MPLQRQPAHPRLGELISRFVRDSYPRDTAKHVARRWGVSATTAANVVKGHVSIPTLTKALAAEGWGFWDKIGAAVTGETYAQFEERALLTVIEKADHARSKLGEARARRAALDPELWLHPGS